MEQANFGKLLDESLSTLDFQIGTIITGVIVDLKPDWVTVHVGLKSEPVLARSEFLADESDNELEIGDEVKVTLEAVEDGYGETRVSRLRAMHDESWLNLEESLKTGSIVKGYINGKVRGGMTVDVAGVRAFLPGSLVDSKQLESFDHLEKTFQFDNIYSILCLSLSIILQTDVKVIFSISCEGLYSTISTEFILD